MRHRSTTIELPGSLVGTRAPEHSRKCDPCYDIPGRHHLMYVLDVTPMRLGVYEAIVLERSSRFEEEKRARRYISSIDAAIYLSSVCLILT